MKGCYVYATSLPVLDNPEEVFNLSCGVKQVTGGCLVFDFNPDDFVMFEVACDYMFFCLEKVA